MKKFLYYFGLINLLPARLFLFKTKRYYEDDSKQNKRLKGSAIIISNHRSFWDAIVIAFKYFFRRLHYLVQDLYKNRKRLLKFIISCAGGVFVDKEKFNFDFVEKGKQVTNKGRPLLIFPEGNFKFGFEPARFSTGYIMLAINSAAPIVPIVNDFNYGLFKRVNLMVGNSIDLSEYKDTELTRSVLNQINDTISKKFLILFYKLKKQRANRFSNNYISNTIPQAGEMIRVLVDNAYHYGVYLNDDTVYQFGTATDADQDKTVNTTNLADFCAGSQLEVRTLKRSEKRKKRKLQDIKDYAEYCVGKGDYCSENNNSLDFANRITFNI